MTHNPHAPANRTTFIGLEVSTYGTQAQTDTTIKGILRELELRGYNVKLLTTA